MNTREQAQAVEDLLGGARCPWCNGDMNPVTRVTIRNTYTCPSCKKFCFSEKPHGVPAYKVGRYWTDIWEWSYEANGAKPVRPQKPKAEEDWTAGVNTKKPRRRHDRKRT